MKRGKAPGVDGVNVAEYGEDLEEKLKALVGRRTSGKRFRAKLVAMNEWLKGVRNMFLSADWWRILRWKLNGHYQYYGVTGNWRGIPDASNLTLSDRFQARYRGLRVSFGYPACPALEDQEKLFALLNPSSIGVTLTENHMMEPEASVSALVFHNPHARYFSVGE
jgi:hypothetical protein